MLRVLALSAALSATTVGAHPHVFIDTGLVLEVDAQGRATSVEVIWAYDELYSLLILEEYKLDGDYDGVLTQEEIDTLLGFDANWVEGFEGDLYMSSGGEKVTLGKPVASGLSFEDGKIVSRHKRALDASAEGLIVQAYDPGFYSAYDLTRGVEVNGPCTYFIDPADIQKAMADLEELMFARPQSELEEQFPEVGQSFADTVTITCN